MIDTSRQYYEGIGRRKKATARVRLYPGGEGKFFVNDKPAEEFFSRQSDLHSVNQVFKVTGTTSHYDMTVKVNGGGITGQSGAVVLGVARALLKIDESMRRKLRQYGMLTRDPRNKERKKPGLKRARKAPQYTKR